MNKDDIIQSAFNSLFAAWRRKRSETQLTLGGLIDALENMAPDTEITGLGGMNSYRGYYEDLAFEPITGSETAAKLLSRCTDALGTTLTGYKGGEYVVDLDAPLWVAPFGCTGVRLMAIDSDGTVVISPLDSSELAQ